ncbi:preprotein translocase subunit SecE [Candidatus Saccharibacteria bacterium RIFCSPHIGHO2_01_FULL_45_15]|nr:MAG: preprotein translocase subunit SecE [Candidatus Saccharibacteria bacterium RIFCSPHIGHO2_01_FULL_45_15]OGL26969.1 MAG: preprotein translocase subunit SecE [Candidatus Saccharibacteria bacterium RIFCSPHIGHO2_02_FULL_46_12]OGL32929.1 MAG: preprotein translocase subunit SecE [Candidatus Saccharibacteria bacterium RIFCSPHIGHO2_12_FULL_44_22]
MADKKKASQKNDATVTRIKATDDTKPAPSKKTAKTTKTVTAEVVAKPTPGTEQKERKVRKKPTPKGLLRPFIAIGGYFKGAWYELKQVRWPTRKATWSLTLAVLIYTAFFMVLVLLLDALFKYLFDLILGS